MRANRGRDTKPELAIRRSIHRAGLRYRVDVRPEPTLARRADIVFSRQRIAVFVDGCFWHGCPLHSRASKTNLEYWEAKVAANRARDADTTARLAEAGWRVLRFWEHVSPEQASAEIVAAVSGSA